MKTAKGCFIYKIFICLFFILTLSCSQDQINELKKQVTAGRPFPDDVMETVMDMCHVPGVSIAVIIDGQIDWVKGYGVYQNGKPERVDSTTLFQAASISKPVSAVVALRMVDKGYLTLDEDVNLKLQSWKIPENEFTKNEPVTLRRLLSHSAGLPMHGVPEFEADDELPTLVQILEGEWSTSAKPVYPFIEPGTMYKYSGGGYIVLQVLLNNITKRPFAELANELVLQPAGMVSSTFEQPLPKHLWPHAAVGHHLTGIPIKGRWHTLPEQATGGLWTTPKDLACFMIELWRSYKGKSDKLLPKNLAQEMLTRQIDNFGLGLSLPNVGVSRFQHGGGNAGYRCQMTLSIEGGDGFVIMTNSDSGEKLIWKVFELIGHAYGWQT
ncbi:serine hydrolase [candidate division KSB1 bacterium]|nr:serine hydrolase [candidate division KSB1 bacterium]